MSFSPRPITAADKVSHARDASGLAKWAQSSRFFGFATLLLGWFTIPVEVVMRHSFGQRWFTRANFLAGFVLLFILSAIQYLIASVRDWFNDFIDTIVSSINPLHEHQVSQSNVQDNANMVAFLLLYLFLGSYHLFRIWWRNRTNTAVHSFSDGTSWLEWPTTHILAPVLNAIAHPFLWLYNDFLPKDRKVEKVPKLISNPIAVTNTVIEPLFLLWAAFDFLGILSFYMFIAAVALAINSSWKETAKLTKILDFQDAILDAKAMKQMREDLQKNEVQRKETKQPKIDSKKSLEIIQSPKISYPDVAIIIEKMHAEKQQN